MLEQCGECGQMHGCAIGGDGPRTACHCETVVGITVEKKPYINILADDARIRAEAARKANRERLRATVFVRISDKIRSACDKGARGCSITFALKGHSPFPADMADDIEAMVVAAGYTVARHYLKAELMAMDISWKVADASPNQI